MVSKKDKGRHHGGCHQSASNSSAIAPTSLVSNESVGIYDYELKYASHTEPEKKKGLRNTSPASVSLIAVILMAC